MINPANTPQTAGPSVSVDGVRTSFRLLPAGLFRANDGRPVGLGGWLTSAHIAAELITQAQQSANDLVIDYEHQSLLTEKNGQPAPAAGWFRQMEWREGDGLYAINVRWTPAAQRMLQEKEYRYLSPVFLFDPNSGAVQRILSAALTNNPALDGLTDLAAATHQHSLQARNQDPEVARANEVLRQIFGADATLVGGSDACALSGQPGARIVRQDQWHYRQTEAEWAEVREKLKGMVPPGTILPY